MTDTLHLRPRNVFSNFALIGATFLWFGGASCYGTPQLLVVRRLHNEQAHNKRSHPHLATIAVLRQRVRLGMTQKMVYQSIKGLTFLPGGKATFDSYPQGGSREIDLLRCTDGTVTIGYSVCDYGQKPETATVAAIGGPHFMVGDADAIP